MLPHSAEDEGDLTVPVDLLLLLLLQTRAVFLSDVIAGGPSSYLGLAVGADDRVVTAVVREAKAGEGQRTRIVVGAMRPVGERCQATHFTPMLESALHPFSAY